MKKNTFFSLAALVCALASSSLAMSGDTSAYQGAVFNTEAQKSYQALYSGAPTHLSIGAYLEREKRGIDVNGSIQDWSIQHSVAYVGWDLTRWLTVRAGGGENTIDVNGFSGDSDAEWIAGGTLRLLDYFIMDPIIGDESYWLGLDLDGQYTGAHSKTPAGDLTWNEISAALVFTLSAKTERWGFVDRMSVYGGPAYSGIAGSSSGFGADIREDAAMGFIAGLALAPSDNLTLKAEVLHFGATSFGFGASFHF